jgi:hypothetical protein
MLKSAGWDVLITEFILPKLSDLKDMFYKSVRGTCFFVALSVRCSMFVLYLKVKKGRKTHQELCTFNGTREFVEWCLQGREAVLSLFAPPASSSAIDLRGNALYIGEKLFRERLRTWFASSNSGWTVKSLKVRKFISFFFFFFSPRFSLMTYPVSTRRCTKLFRFKVRRPITRKPRIRLQSSRF